MGEDNNITNVFWTHKNLYENIRIDEMLKI